MAVTVASLPSFAYLAGRIHYHYIVNADHLLLPELMLDLANGGSVDRWAVPYASYLIPDWPMYGLALLLTPSAPLAVAVFAFLQAVFLYFALRRLAQVFDTTDASVIALVGLSIFALYAASGSHPLVYLAAAYNHFGTAILVVWAMAFTLDWLRTPSRRLVWWSGLASAAAVLSDRIFIVWFLVPAAVALGVLYVRKQLAKRQLVEWLAVHVVLSVAVLPISGLIFTTRSEYDISFGFDDPMQGLRQLWENVTRVLENSPTVIPLVALAVAVVAWQFRKGQSLGGQRLNTETGTFLAAFLVVAVVASAIAQVLMIGVPPGPRHSLALLVLPIALLPAVTLGSPTGKPKLAIIALGLLPIIGVVPVFALFARDIDFERSPVASDCITRALDATGSDHGIANYWDARQVEVFSNGALQLTPYNFLLYPDYTNASLDGFADSYDFAVTSEVHAGWQFSLPLLDHLNGQPLHRTVCDQWTVSDWGEGGLRIPVFETVGDRIDFDGCIMSSRLASPDAECQLAVATSDQRRDFLVFGPYAHVSPGEYQITATYSSSEPSETDIGAWDVSIDTLPDATLLASGRATGTNGDLVTLIANVTVPATDRATSVLEWQLVTEGGVAVVFESLTIERTG